MAREYFVKESSRYTLPLNDQEATLLAALGRSMAAAKDWWGHRAEDDANRAVIRMERAERECWTVTFREVVGVVAIGDICIRVAPKIPAAHFNHVIRHSSIAPRIASERVTASDDEHLVELLARWFLDEADTLLRYGLRRGYEERREELSLVEGRVELVETAVANVMGRAVAVCTYEELGEDTALNRLVRGAAKTISGLNAVSEPLRVRARKLWARMPSTAAVRILDMRTQVDRLTAHYSKVVPLAKLLLDGGGVTGAEGTLHGSAFLIRTPEIIEDGLRSLLAELLPEHRITKRRLVLGDSGMSINPDLVFDNGIAVGDVKYRFLGVDWDRGHFNQAVTFATGFRATKCLVIGFVDRALNPLPRPATIGSIMVQALGWRTDAAYSPEKSAFTLAGEVRRWLDERSP